MDQALHCGHCRHELNDAGNYHFSRDFARYMSPSPVFLLTWCVHCSHVTVNKQPWLARLLHIPATSRTPAEIFTPDRLRDHPLALRKSSYDGRPYYFAAYNLLRLVWWCLMARVEADSGRKDPQAALELAIAKLPATAVSLMIVATRNGHTLPLVQQITEGMYLRDLAEPEHLLHDAMVRGWIASSPNVIAAAAVLLELDRYNSGGGPAS